MSAAQKPYLTPAEAAAEIDIRVQSVLAWIASGELPATNLSLSRDAKRPTWRIRRVDLDLFMASRRAVQTTPVTKSRPRIEPDSTQYFPES